VRASDRALDSRETGTPLVSLSLCYLPQPD
jgi:hypothetical protein